MPSRTYFSAVQGNVALMLRLTLLFNPILYYILPEQVGKKDNHMCNFYMESFLMRHSDYHFISFQTKYKGKLIYIVQSIYVVESNFSPTSLSFEILVCQFSQFELNCISKNMYKKANPELQISWKVITKPKISKSVSAVHRKFGTPR